MNERWEEWDKMRKFVWTAVTANGMLLCIATQVHFMHPTHHEKADSRPHSHAHTAVCCLQLIAPSAVTFICVGTSMPYNSLANLLFN